VEFALRHGQDTTFMAAKPGEIMGYLACGHPFLDGNWRTMMPVHAVLPRRAGFGIDWAATMRADYESALMQELDDPGKNHLDRYLSRFIRKLWPMINWPTKSCEQFIPTGATTRT
jgi:cell filamentation protein